MEVFLLLWDEFDDVLGAARVLFGLGSRAPRGLT
jgi:hypothetical protein